MSMNLIKTSILSLSIGFAASLASTPSLSAQSLESDTCGVTLKEVRPATMIISARLGDATMRDTYLTPLEYKGPCMSVQLERWRLMQSRKLTNQQIFTLDYATLNNNTNIGDTWSGRLRYRYALHFKPLHTEHWQLLVGPYAALDMGFNYNLKLANSNNPATARITNNFGASVLSTHNFCLWNHPIAFHVQAQTPLLGTAFMQDYGASYYETFYIGSSDDGMHTTSLHNLRDLDVLAAFDVPLAIVPWFRRSTSTLRLGWQWHYESTKINHIQTRFSASQLVIGWVYDYIPFHRSKHRDTPFGTAW